MIRIPFVWAAVISLWIQRRRVKEVTTVNYIQLLTLSLISSNFSSFSFKAAVSSANFASDSRTINKLSSKTDW